VLDEPGQGIEVVVELLDVDRATARAYRDAHRLGFLGLDVTRNRVFIAL
jgi:hypothetical protein